jgi:hypothetical protein
VTTLDRVRAAAEPLVGAHFADDIARNVVMALDYGAGIDCIARAVEHRRKNFGLDLDDEQTAQLIGSIEMAWGRNR